MPKTVFILGAGASKSAGAPLMGNFLDIADGLLQRGQVSDAKDDFERVFSAIGILQGAHSKAMLDLTNIETVFSTFEMAKTIRWSGFQSLANIDVLIGSLKKVIVRTLEQTIEFRDEGSKTTPLKDYNQFVSFLNYLRKEAIPTHEVSILTFNYDIALDYALYSQNCDADYGIPSEQIYGARTRLFKLHGSLNWIEEKDSVVPVNIRNLMDRHGRRPNSTGLPIHLPFYTELANERANDGQITSPVVVPPTWQKGAGHRALSEVWQRASEVLSTAENIVVIGYSLPESDAFFRYFYALGSVGTRPLKSFLVFDPDPDVRERFQRLLGNGALRRFEFYPIQFGESIGKFKTKLTL